MTVTCCIRYVIDPYKKDDFEEYARKWLTIIPALGGDLLGYFLPHEGTNNVALAMIGFECLASYETYRGRLRSDAASLANLKFAQERKFILEETRTFLVAREAPMIAVIFEVDPAPGRRQAYLDLAAQLKPALAAIDGFISIERFESLTIEGKVLSLSFWRDEAAVMQWRLVEDHRRAQAAGRGGVFADYRLRVANVLRDYGMRERDEAPADSRAANG